MTTSDGGSRAALLAGRVLYFLLPLPVAWLVLSLMSQQMRFHDVGINMGANNGFLLFFVAPALLLVLYAGAVLALVLSRRRVRSTWLRLAAGSVVVCLLGACAFALHWHWNADRSAEAGGFGAFIDFYLATVRAR